jgi:hypothetical protein
MSMVMRAAGLDVCHERLGEDGTVDASFGPRVDPDKYVVLHQVRSPLVVLANHTIARQSSWERVSHYVELVKEPMLLRVMRYWLDWTAIAETKARWTYRIENIDNVWPDICKEIGIEHCPKALDGVSRNQNTRVGLYAPITWTELEAIDAKLVDEIRETATRYGYDEKHLFDAKESA